MSTRIHIVVTEPLLQQIDAARGDVPRSAFVRRAVERALEVGAAFSAHGSGDAPAPAEQPVVESREPWDVRPDPQAGSLDDLGMVESVSVDPWAAEQARRDAFARAGRKK